MLWQGFALVLGGAFLHALYQVTNKKLLTKQAPADCVSTINFLGSGIILLVIAFLFSPPKIESWFDWPSGLFWPMMATALLNIVIGFGNTRALEYGDASLVTPISAAQPMIILIPSMLILGEVPGFWGYIGLLLMAVGTYIFSFAEEGQGVANAQVAQLGREERSLLRSVANAFPEQRRAHSPIGRLLWRGGNQL